MSNEQIYRKEALERLASPDELDRLFSVLGMRAWLPLLTLAALCLGAVVWGFVGRVPETVAGAGVLINPGRVRGVQTPFGGQVVELTARTGQVVNKGDLLAQVNQPDLRQKLIQARARLNELKRFDETQRGLDKTRLAHEHTVKTTQDALLVESIAELKKYAAQRGAKTEEYTVKMREQLKGNREDVRAMVGNLQKELTTLRVLLTKKVGTTDQVLQADNSALMTARLRVSEMDLKMADLAIKELENQDFLFQQKSRIIDLEVQRHQLELKSTQTQQEIAQSQEARRSQIREVEDQIQLLEGQLSEQGEIRSPHAGRILELAAIPGQVIAPGSRFGAIEMADEGTVGGSSSHLKVIAYFPLRSGKRLKEGMSVRVTPSTVERERYGSILGTVMRVSDFPVTPESANSVVGNPELVRALHTPGGMIEAEIELERADTFSGLRWTSAGPPLHFSAGTTAQVWVTVEERAPITYLLPILRSSVLGGDAY